MIVRASFSPDVFFFIIVGIVVYMQSAIGLCFEHLLWVR